VALAAAERQTKFKTRRLESGLSQFQLAVKTGISPQTISNVEQGKHLPQVTTALAFARALNTTVDDLFGPDEQ
jgi:putative transcriptional regulator